MTAFKPAVFKQTIGHVRTMIETQSYHFLCLGDGKKAVPQVRPPVTRY